MQTATLPGSDAERTRLGWIQGAIGMVIFSASLPATRVAVLALDPLFVATARALVAALIGLLALRAWDVRRPQRREFASVTVVAAGVVIGFPLLSALALRQVTSAHALVFLALLPMSTAFFAVLRGGERPPPLFWVFAIAGAAIVTGYAVTRNGDRGAWRGDAFMVAAIVVCGLGYAEGARLSRRLGGWQVISWALVFALPVTLPLAVVSAPRSPAAVPLSAWIGVAYLAVFSMFVGFIFWYRGLALGGAATVGQLQLLQPFLGLAIAATLLGEQVDAATLAAAGGTLLCIAAVRRFSITRSTSGPGTA